MLLSYIAFFLTLLSLELGVMALWLDRRSPLNRSMAASGFLYAEWLLCSIVVYTAPNDTAMLFYDLSFIGSYFLPPTLLWFYLALSGKSLRVRIWSVLPTYAIAAFVFWQCLRTNFRYVSFHPGPIGNIGAAAASTLWSTLLTDFFGVAQVFAVVIMLRARGREAARRVRRLLAIVVVSLVGTIVLVAVALRAERVFSLPPLAALAGGPSLIVNFYLVLKLRYLRRNDTLIEKQLESAVDHAVLFLNENGRIISANGAAARGLAAEGELVGRDLASLTAEPERVVSEWEAAREGRYPRLGIACRIGGSSFIIRLTPHYDRFRDFIGAVAILEKSAHLDETAKRFDISPREKEIIAMLRHGFSNQEIADCLFVTVGTVKNHLVHIFQKTGVSNRVELSALFQDPDAGDPSGCA